MSDGDKVVLVAFAPLWLAGLLVFAFIALILGFFSRFKA